MTFSAAKREFDIRYYRWSIGEFETEIEESLPSSRLFKTGSVWEALQFIRLLDRPKQRTLARALIKRFHAHAVAALGETTSAEEIALLSARDNFRDLRRIYGFIIELEATNRMSEARFWLNQVDRASLRLLTSVPTDDAKSLRSSLDLLLGTTPRSLEDEIALRKQKGEHVKFISKRKLLKVTAERFQNAFAGLCVETVREIEPDPFLSFDMKCSGWVLRTNFWFGRNRTLLNYSHAIASDNAVEHHGPNGKYMAPLVIGSGISFSSWLGITSQAQWECLADEEVEPACNAALKLCAHFFDVLPRLLKGLEFGNLTPDEAGM